MAEGGSAGSSELRPDPELLARAFAGDRAAFQEVIEQLWGLVFVFIRSRVSDPERTLDLTQETFLQAWEKRGSLRRSESAISWILAIASRKVIDSHRFRGSRPESRLLESEEPSGPAAAAGADGAGPGLDARHAEALRDALAEVPELYRTVLILRYWSGLTPAQIARLLGEPEGTIRNRIFRAHLLIRQRLSDAPMPRGAGEESEGDVT